MKLNIGCGNNILKDYINIDIRKIDGVDLILDLEKQELPYDNESVDEILAYDVLEHISHNKIWDVLNDMYRVLKKGGILHIRVPDTDNIYLKSLKYEGIERFKMLSYWLGGGQDYPENTHKSFFTKDSLKAILEYYGFKIIELWNDDSNIVCKAVKE